MNDGSTFAQRKMEDAVIDLVFEPTGDFLAAVAAHGSPQIIDMSSGEASDLGDQAE